MAKEVYENKNARLEIDDSHGVVTYWVQSGIAGMLMYAPDLANLYELLQAYIEEFEDE